MPVLRGWENHKRIQKITFNFLHLLLFFCSFILMTTNGENQTEPVTAPDTAVVGPVSLAPAPELPPPSMSSILIPLDSMLSMKRFRCWASCSITLRWCSLALARRSLAAAFSLSWSASWSPRDLYYKILCCSGILKAAKLDILKTSVPRKNLLSKNYANCTW